MLTHLIVSDFDSNPDVFNRVIPGTSVTRLPLIRGNELGLRSTHGRFSRSVRKAVYLVRDVRYSMPSFYRFTTTREGVQRTPSEWTSLYARGLYGPRWDQHVSSWLGRGRSVLGERLLLVKYEDMKAAPAPTLERVANFLDLNFDAERVARAIEMSAPEVMRGWEKKERGLLHDPNASFYRGGNVAEWETLFDEADRGRILDLSGEALQLTGYSEATAHGGGIEREPLQNPNSIGGSLG